MHYINYRENRQRGTIDFPVEFYHVTPSHPQYQMPIHWHVEYEFVRVLEGSLLLTLDEEEFRVSAGFSVLIPAGAVHSGIPETNCVYECIVFDIHFLMSKSDSAKKKIHQLINHEVELRSCLLENCDNIHPVIWKLFASISEKKPGYELVVQGCLFEFLGELFAQNFFTEVSRQSSRDLKRILQLKRTLEFIEDSYSLPISLQDMAGSVKMSPKYFCRFFHEMTHRTPIDYLNFYRIDRACYLLITTDQSITEVAYSCGFNDLSYFIKTFKKYKGTTPGKYLK